MIWPSQTALAVNRFTTRSKRGRGDKPYTVAFQSDPLRRVVDCPFKQSFGFQRQLARGGIEVSQTFELEFRGEPGPMVRAANAELQELFKALRIKERVLGKDHPDVATTLVNLAGVLNTIGRSKEALELCNRGFEIVERTISMQSLISIEGIRFVIFDERDVVRHSLVQSIITAYEALDRQRETAGAAGAGPRGASRPSEPSAASR